MPDFKGPGEWRRKAVQAQGTERPKKLTRKTPPEGEAKPPPSKGTKGK
jgi:hypothetical protein